jgi:hypothetical protein
MIDGLLLNNSNTSRVLEDIKKRRKRKKKSSNQKKDGVIFKLPYLNEATSLKYKDTVKQSGLPIRIVEKPGRKLKYLLTDSTPFDKSTCTTNNCRTCSSLTEGNCTTTNAVYQITWQVDNCQERYGGGPTDHSTVGLMNTSVVQLTQYNN